VSPHGFAGGFRVVSLDRIEDPLMVDLTTLRTTGNFEDSQALFPQQPDDGVEQ
jgi:hypothetical protein